MGLNCRPNQWAWIDVPRTPVDLAMGLDQVHGHVVKTERLEMCGPLRRPAWSVTPTQTCVPPGPIPEGVPLEAGQRLVLSHVPDAWLRPLDDLPPEEIEALQRELSLS